MKLALDLEADSLTPTKVWCVCTQDVDSGEERTFTHLDNFKGLKEYVENSDYVIAHNAIAFDIRVLRTLLDISIPREKVIDTLVLSRLLKYNIEGGHSLEAWGLRLKVPKGEFSDWTQLTNEMIKYCRQDVRLLVALYNFLMSRALGTESFKKVIQVEHQMAWICQDMHDDGFPFDIDKAKELYAEIEERLKDVDNKIKEAFPPRLKPIGVVLPKLTKHGTISRSNLRWWDSDDLTVFQADCPFTRCEWETFNPQSPKQVVERIEEWWEPTEKTDAHISAERDRDKKKLEYFRRYGWKISETNLSTLREEAPEGARLLVLRLLLASRLRTLTEWFNSYNPETKCIHGTFNHIGTWTHRMSHTKPNMGNIATEKSIKYKSKELVDLALKYGARMRSLWTVPNDDWWLVGTDAEGIQLRIFAHYIQDEKFTFAVTQGKKENATDPHSLNKQALGSICKSRDDAKTFIYAFLLGAGDKKVTVILKCTLAEAKRAKQNFIEAYPGLKVLKETVIPDDSLRGYFIGFDGRFVPCDDDHLMLAGYLQNGEACIMKHALIKWRQKLDELKIEYRLVNFIHDEWQTLVKGTKETAELVASIQRDAIRQVGEEFNLNCPFAGSSSIGKNWHETH